MSIFEFCTYKHVLSSSAHRKKVKIHGMWGKMKNSLCPHTMIFWKYSFGDNITYTHTPNINRLHAHMRVYGRRERKHLHCLGMGSAGESIEYILIWTHNAMARLSRCCRCEYSEFSIGRYSVYRQGRETASIFHPPSPSKAQNSNTRTARISRYKFSISDIH